MKKIVGLFFIIFMSSVLAMGTLFFAMPETETLAGCLAQQSEEYQVPIERLEYVTCHNVRDLEGIERLKDVIYLDVSGNNLVEVPATISSLKKLRTVNLANNRFREVPTALFSLKNLEEVILSNNQIEYVSPDIAKLQQLRRLDVSGNKIIELGSGVPKLQHLQHLSVSTNRITNLPELRSLIQLSSLDVSNNQLGELPDLTAVPLEYFAANGNILCNAEVETKNQRFSIEQSYYLKTVQTGMLVEVNESWPTFSDDLYQMVVFSNGVKPYGFVDYRLANFKNEDGQSVQFSDYFDVNTKNVLQTGVLTGNIGMLSPVAETTIFAKDTVKIDLRTRAGDDGDKNGQVVGGAGDGTGDTGFGGNTEQTGDLGNDGGSTVGQSLEMPVGATITPAIEEQVVQGFDWYHFFMKNQENQGGDWWTYFIDRFFLLRMTLALLALLPVLLLAVIIMRANKMYTKTVDTIYKRSE